MMRAEQYPHNTAKQVEQYLAAALQLVNEVAPPEDLRVAYFTKAVDLFAGKQIVLTPVHESPLLTGRGPHSLKV